MLETIFPQPLFRTRHFFVLLSIALLCNLLTWAALLWQIPYTEETVFLHANVFYGIDLVGEWWKLLLMPISGVVVLLINVLVLRLSKAMDAFLLHTVMIATSLYEVMLFIAALFVIFLNN